MGSLKLAYVLGHWQGGARGAIRGKVVIATEAAYTVGEAGGQAEGWPGLWAVVDANSEVGF